MSLAVKTTTKANNDSGGWGTNATNTGWGKTKVPTNNESSSRKTTINTNKNSGGWGTKVTAFDLSGDQDTVLLFASPNNCHYPTTCKLSNLLCCGVPSDMFEQYK